MTTRKVAYDPSDIMPGLYAIAHALDNVAGALRDLGNSNASTPLGAMEALGLVMKEGLDSIRVSIGAGLTEVAEGLSEVAGAIAAMKGTPES